MKRVFVSSVFLFLIVLIGCSSDNPTVNETSQINAETDILLQTLGQPPENRTEALTKLTELLPGRFIPAEQTLPDVGVQPSPGGIFLGEYWMNSGYTYIRVYSLHYGKVGPMLKYADHMNLDVYSTNKQYTNRDNGGIVKNLANLHLSWYRSNCLYIYDSVKGYEQLKCINASSAWDKAKQIAEAAKDFLVGIGITIIATITIAIAWLIYVAKFVPIP